MARRCSSRMSASGVPVTTIVGTVAIFGSDSCSWRNRQPSISGICKSSSTNRIEGSARRIRNPAAPPVTATTSKLDAWSVRLSISHTAASSSITRTLPGVGSEMSRLTTRVSLPATHDGCRNSGESGLLRTHAFRLLLVFRPDCTNSVDPRNARVAIPRVRSHPFRFRGNRGNPIAGANGLAVIHRSTEKGHRRSRNWVFHSGTRKARSSCGDANQPFHRQLEPPPSSPWRAPRLPCSPEVQR